MRRIPDFASVHELRLDQLPHEESGAVRWDEVFGAPRPLRIEIGVGSSTFLIEVAIRHPEFHYVGFEYSEKRVRKFLKKVEAAGVAGIRMLRVDASLALARIFSSGSIDHFYINHPDPWPKRRHEKKRFVSPKNAGTMLELLRPGGGISLRTDFAAYAQQMLEVLDATPGLINLAGKRSFALCPGEGISTLYESKFLKAGRQIYYLEYARTP